MPQFNLDNYETVEDRLRRFWADHPNGRVATLMEHYDENRVVFRASIYFEANDLNPIATGYAEEIRGASPVNKTSHVENAETSAIGRALANCNYAPKGARPSREEMTKASRQDIPQGAPAVKQESIVPSDDELFGEVKKVFNATPVPSGDGASPAQLKMINAISYKLQLSKDDKLALASEVLGRKIGDMAEIGKKEASKVIQTLQEREQS